MIEMMIHVSDDLAKRCQTAGPWLPAIIDLGFVGFRTPAAATVSEIIDFLSENPSSKELLGFHVSEQAQTRLRRLLALNEAGCLSEAEQSELDELQRLEHFVIMLKSQAGINYGKTDH